MATKTKAPEKKAADAKGAEAKDTQVKGTEAKGTATKAAPGKKPNALQQPLQPSAELASVVGDKPLPRGEVVSKVWSYIKEHNLQDSEDRRSINADEKLKKVFGKNKVTMFEMNKHLSQHLK
ncbi:SWIB/MDM2 domain-containing protein [Pseudoroseomonas globiformis]|uniref:SWIB/MDM2 domain-containing protein n=1 Tax=Teichococcus globiformis TaxID=2307229 RepID=A0ABV7G789_9PROT